MIPLIIFGVASCGYREFAVLALCIWGGGEAVGVVIGVCGLLVKI